MHDLPQGLKSEPQTHYHNPRGKTSSLPWSRITPPRTTHLERVHLSVRDERVPKVLGQRDESLLIFLSDFPALFFVFDSSFLPSVSI